MDGAERCEVRACEVGRGVFAIQPIPAGECVIDLREVFEDRPGRHTIQVDEHRHQAETGETDDYINHACQPTALVDAENLRIVAHRAIAAGEEITIHYAASEWDMVEPFACRCDGTERTIQGFRHLSPAQQDELRPLVPAWLWARRHP